jgi:hypothetical protein
MKQEQTKPAVNNMLKIMPIVLPLWWAVGTMSGIADASGDVSSGEASGSCNTFFDAMSVALVDSSCVRASCLKPATESTFTNFCLLPARIGDSSATGRAFAPTIARHEVSEEARDEASYSIALCVFSARTPGLSMEETVVCVSSPSPNFIRVPPRVVFSRLVFLDMFSSEKVRP